MSSRSTAIALPYTRSIWVFPWESPWKTLRVIKCHSGRSRAHLTVSTERVLFQTNEVSISPFTMGPLLASPNDIHNSENCVTAFGAEVPHWMRHRCIYVSCKNPYTQSKFRPIALQRTSNWSAFVLFNSAGKNHHFLPGFFFFLVF